jgi:hypothetical protein
MPTFNFAVFSNPVEGKEAAYNDWYSNQHIHDIARVPQISSARRYEVVPLSEKVAARLGARYLALYDAEADNAAGIAAGINTLRDQGKIPTSDAIDRSSMRAVYYEEVASTGFVEEAAAGAARHVMVVLANAVEGRDDEFNDWYTNQHIRDVAKVPGILRARRYRAAPESQEAAEQLGYRYAAIYDIATDDIAAIPAGIAALGERGDMPMSDTFAPRGIIAYFREIASAD